MFFYFNWQFIWNWKRNWTCCFYYSKWFLFSIFKIQKI